MRLSPLACAATLLLLQAGVIASLAQADELPVKAAVKHHVYHHAQVAPVLIVPTVVAVPVRTVCDEVVEGKYTFRGGKPAAMDTYQIPEPSFDRGANKRPTISPFHGVINDYPPPRPDPKPMPRLLCGSGSAIDGNTIALGRQSFRLFGIEAPSPGETCPNTHGGRWDCGRSAQRELARHLAVGLVVCQAIDQEGDAIFSAHCEIDGRDIAAAMVRDGFASAQYRDTPMYVQREGEAVRAGRGLWQAYKPSYDSGQAVGAAAYPR